MIQVWLSSQHCFPDMYSSFELVKLIVKPPPDVLGDQIMKENFTLFAAIVSHLMMILS